jgi:hypothetical protein
MTKRAAVIPLAFLVIAFTGALAHRVSAQVEPLDPKVIRWDKGADKIDVSKYPAEMKRKYKVFTEICGKCHTLARAVNCDFAVEDDWERYIKRMMRRGRGLITPDVAQDAFDFAVYDSKIRKKDLYDQKTRDAAGR